MKEKIRTLGLYQPFAALMLHGKVETRFVKTGRKPPFPLGKYLIYSTVKSYDWLDNGLDGISTPMQVKAMEQIEDDALFRYGMALMIGDLVKIIDPLTPDIQNTWVAYVAPNADSRRVGLVFENTWRIEPFAIRGKQGIGFLSEADYDKIKCV